MGILEKLFGKKKETLKLAELSGWLSAKEKEASLESGLKIREIGREIKDKISSARENLSLLKSAELFNKKIPEREKQIMEGNRMVYIQKTQFFLDNSSLQAIANLQEAEKLPSLLESYDRELQLFTKGSERPYIFLSEFFRNEAARVAGAIREIDLLVSALKAEQAGAENKAKPLMDLKAELEELRGQERRLGALKKEEKGLSEQAKALSLELASIESGLDATQRSKAYKKLEESRSLLRELEKENSIVENTIFESFSALDRPLRKYSKMSTDEQKISAYLENPIVAFLEDTDLKIIEILSKIRDSLARGELESDKKKQEKLIKKIGNLTLVRLVELSSKHGSLTEQIHSLKEEISKDPTSKKQEELLLKKRNLLDDLKKIEGEIENLSKESSKLDPKKIIGSIKSELDIQYSLSLVEG